MYMYVLSVLNLCCVWRWWSPISSTQHMANSGCSNRHNHMTVLALTHVRYTLVNKTTHKFPYHSGTMDTSKEIEYHSPILFISIHKDDPSESGAYISEMQPPTICSTRPKNRLIQIEGNEMVSAPNKVLTQHSLDRLSTRGKSQHIIIIDLLSTRGQSQHHH